LTTTNREIIPLVYQHNNIIQAFYYKKIYLTCAEIQ